MAISRIRKLLISTVLLALYSCSQTNAVLPVQQNTIPAGYKHTLSATMTLGDTWLSFEHHRKAEDICLLVTLKRDTLPKGCKLRLSLSGEPYSTARGKEWQYEFSTIYKPGEHIFLLKKSDFPQDGGPYDYRVEFTLLAPDGKVLDSRNDRLNSRMPGPGWDASYEKENQRDLKKLQAAAEKCASMRLQMTYHYEIMVDTPVELPLNASDTAELRKLIGRMRPVRTYVHEVIPGYMLQLVLLDAEGKELATMDPFDVTKEQHVSPENLAHLSSFALSNDDAASWFRIINSPETTEAIESAVKKARSKR